MSWPKDNDCLPAGESHGRTCEFYGNSPPRATGSLSGRSARVHNIHLWQLLLNVEAKALKWTRRRLGRPPTYTASRCPEMKIIPSVQWRSNRPVQALYRNFVEGNIETPRISRKRWRRILRWEKKSRKQWNHCTTPCKPFYQFLRSGWRHLMTISTGQFEWSL